MAPYQYSRFYLSTARIHLLAEVAFRALGLAIPTEQVFVALYHPRSTRPATWEQEVLDLPISLAGVSIKSFLGHFLLFSSAITFGKNSLTVKRFALSPSLLLAKYCAR
jgi:hypothetical protein